VSESKGEQERLSELRTTYSAGCDKAHAGPLAAATLDGALMLELYPIILIARLAVGAFEGYFHNSQ